MHENHAAIKKKIVDAVEDADDEEDAMLKAQDALDEAISELRKRGTHLRGFVVLQDDNSLEIVLTESGKGRVSFIVKPPV